jgi:hypothetical protein
MAKQIIYLKEGVTAKQLNAVRKSVKATIKFEKTSISACLGYIEWAGEEWFAMLSKTDKKLLMNPKLLCSKLTEKEQARVDKRGFTEHLVMELQKRLATELCATNQSFVAKVLAASKEVVATDVECEVVA